MVDAAGEFATDGHFVGQGAEVVSGLEEHVETLWAPDPTSTDAEPTDRDGFPVRLRSPLVHAGALGGVGHGRGRRRRAVAGVVACAITGAACAGDPADRVDLAPASVTSERAASPTNTTQPTTDPIDEPVDAVAGELVAPEGSGSDVTTTELGTITVTVVTPPAPAPPRPLRLLFTGDVLMHSPLWRQAERNGDGTMDFAPMFGGLRPWIEGADLAVCHLETPVAPPFEAYSTSPRYGVPAEVVDGLAAAGFDHCSTASNHTFDRGVAGVEATIARFAREGITQHGMASTPAQREPILLDVDGLSIGHVSATYGYDGANPPADEPWRSNRIDVDRLLADAALARERGADLVVLSLHWGDSMSHLVSAEQRRIAEAIAASGLVDLVVGHHAHVVQPVELIGRTWVAFGLGNFVSNMPIAESPFEAPDSRDGLVLEVVVDRTTDAPAITQVIARPIWVDQAAGWVVLDVATVRADPNLRDRIGDELDASWHRTAPIVPWLLPAD
jgi:hypothetical protein